MGQRVVQRHTCRAAEHFQQADRLRFRGHREREHQHADRGRPKAQRHDQHRRGPKRQHRRVHGHPVGQLQPHRLAPSERGADRGVLRQTGGIESIRRSHVDFALAGHAQRAGGSVPSRQKTVQGRPGERRQLQMRRKRASVLSHFLVHAMRGVQRANETVEARRRLAQRVIGVNDQLTLLRAAPAPVPGIGRVRDHRADVAHLPRQRLHADTDHPAGQQEVGGGQYQSSQDRDREEPGTQGHLARHRQRQQREREHHPDEHTQHEHPQTQIGERATGQPRQRKAQRARTGWRHATTSLVGLPIGQGNPDLRRPQGSRLPAREAKLRRRHGSACSAAPRWLWSSPALPSECPA